MSLATPVFPYFVHDYYPFLLVCDLNNADNADNASSALAITHVLRIQMGYPLPPELIRPIVAQLWDDRRSLFALLFVSKPWNAEAQRTLYGTLPFPPSWKRESVAPSHILIRRHLRRLALRGTNLVGLECGSSELPEDEPEDDASSDSHGLVDLLHNAHQLKILELGGVTPFDYERNEDLAVDFRPLLSSSGCTFRLTSFSTTDIHVTDRMIEFLKEQTELKELSIFPDMRREPNITTLVGNARLRPGDLPRLRRLEIPLELTPLLHLGERQGLVHLWIQVIGGGRIADQKLSRLAGTLAPIAGSLQTLLTDNISREALESFTTHLPNLRFIGYCPPCWDKVALVRRLLDEESILTLPFHSRRYWTF